MRAASAPLRTRHWLGDSCIAARDPRRFRPASGTQWCSVSELHVACTTRPEGAGRQLPRAEARGAGAEKRRSPRTGPTKPSLARVPLRSYGPKPSNAPSELPGSLASSTHQLPLAAINGRPLRGLTANPVQSKSSAEHHWVPRARGPGPCDSKHEISPVLWSSDPNARARQRCGADVLVCPTLRTGETRRSE